MTRLCVPILVEASIGVDDALEDARAGAAIGAALVEWRIDPLAAEPDAGAAAGAVVRLLRDAPLPSILTCRDADEGGAADIDDEDRAQLLEAVADREPPCPPRYVDLELAAWERSPRLRAAVRRLLGRPGGDGGGGSHGSESAPAGIADAPRLILSSHAFDGRPPDLWSRVARIAAIDDADVVKLAWTARSLRDVAEAAELLAERPKPMIALAMGPFGLASRVLAGRFGGFLSFANLGEATATAPGQPTLAVLRDLYRASSIGPRTRVYGVIGMPVDHSLGPRLHNAGFAEAGLDAVYLPMPVEAGWESFKATLAVLLDTPAFGFAGASVTIPHKEHALAFVRERGGEIEPMATLAGAANTITVNEDGGLRAANTDAPAILALLLPSLGLPDAAGAADTAGAQPWSAAAGLNVLVLGAGGVARAAAAALGGAGARVHVAGRTPERVDALCRSLHGRPRPGAPPGETLHVVPIGPGAVADGDPVPDILINATPVGMATGPDPEGDPLPPTAPLGAGQVVLESVYAPLETPLVRRARAAGATVLTGDAMFERQADLQFRAWSGRSLPDTAWASIRPR